jgi:tetratricopeptide (TPR) repeat protein
MIIYPIIILFLLLVAFALLYRRAYLLESDLQVDRPVSEFKEGESGPKRKVGEAEIDPTIELEPNFKKAEGLFKKKQYISAEKWFIEAAKTDPKNDVIYARLGVIYIEQKNYKDAVEALEEALKLGGGVASRYFNLSYAQNALGEGKEALVSARRAVKLEPRNEKYKKWLDELKSSPF